MRILAPSVMYGKGEVGKSVLEMKDVQGKNFQEIADVLGFPAATDPVSRRRRYQAAYYHYRQAKSKQKA